MNCLLEMSTLSLAFALAGSAYFTGLVAVEQASPVLINKSTIEASSQTPVRRAIVAINPTKGNTAIGLAHFIEVEGGIRIVVTMDNLSPGKHGFHIHEFGDCSAPDASSAGGHFNPTHQKHGGPEFLERHVGDLGNIVANDKGKARYDRVDTVISLNGPNSIIGKSLVVHANPDDFTTQPTGNSGGRIACGLIVAQ